MAKSKIGKALQKMECLKDENRDYFRHDFVDSLHSDAILGNIYQL